MSAYLNALLLSCLSHPLLTLVALWALFVPLADLLPEHRHE